VCVREREREREREKEREREREKERERSLYRNIPKTQLKCPHSKSLSLLLMTLKGKRNKS
jgi:hypothetical protein